MPFNNFPTGINNSPMVKSVFVETYDFGSSSPSSDGFLLSTGENFLLSDNTNFLLSGA